MAAGVKRWARLAGWVSSGFLACAGAHAQSDFGTCDARMFLDQVNTAATISTLYDVGYAASPFTYTTLGTDVARNGIGYNQQDNYIYGIEWQGFSGNELIRVAADGSNTNLGVISGLPVANYNNGVISPTGEYYVIPAGSGTTMYRIDIATRVATPITLSQPVTTVFDLAWHGGQMYGVSSGTLVSITATGTVTSIGPTPNVALASGMWGFTNGLYATNSATAIYAIDPATGATTLMSPSPSTANADGANCPGATIQYDADLSVTKTNTPAQGPGDLPDDTYVAGETRTYTIVVRNNGPFGATDVTIGDPLPAGITAANWTCTGAGGGRCTTTSANASGSGPINQTAVNLPSNATVTYQLTLTVPLGYTGDLSNTVTVTPGPATRDTDPSNNTATDTDPPMPLLTVRKVSVNGVGSFGFTGTNGVPAQTLTTTVAGTSASGVAQPLTTPGIATTVTEDAPPPGYALTGIECTGLGAGGTAAPDLPSRTVTLDAAATVPGADIVCTFTNTLQAADLEVVKAANPSTVTSSDVVSYTLMVTNHGPSAADNAVLTDSPGPGLDCTAPSATATCAANGGASCPAATVMVSDLLGSGITIPVLPAGGQVTVTLQCAVTASGL